MEQPVLKLPLLPGLVTAVCLIFLLALSMTAYAAEPTTTNGKEEKTRNGAGSVGLDLESIELSQGEGGFEIWRLKAEWANMQRVDGKITVDRPKLTYFLPPPDSGEMYIISDTGDIDQKEQILRFIRNVRVWGETYVMTGNLLVYSGRERSMTLPEGGDFSGEGIRGKAPLVRWRMNDKIIAAEGGVSVEFSRQQEMPE